MGLDAVEIIMDAEETFGISISDGAVAEIVTPADLIRYIVEATGASSISRPCLTQRSFHRVRLALHRATDLPKARIGLHTKIKTLFPSSTRSKRWRKFQRLISPLTLPHPDEGFFCNLPPNVRDLVNRETRRQAAQLTLHLDWTHEEVRQMTRLLISEFTANHRFRDTDEFVRDLGLD